MSQKAREAVALAKVRQRFGPVVVRRIQQRYPGFSDWPRLLALKPEAATKLLAQMEPTLSEMIEKGQRRQARVASGTDGR